MSTSPAAPEEPRRGPGRPTKQDRREHIVRVRFSGSELAAVKAAATAAGAKPAEWARILILAAAGPGRMDVVEEDPGGT